MQPIHDHLVLLHLFKLSCENNPIVCRVPSSSALIFCVPQMEIGRNTEEKQERR